MEPHPLLLDVILDKLFGYLEIRHILKCRQVCRKWNEILVPAILHHFDGKEACFKFAFDTNLKWLQDSRTSMQSCNRKKVNLGEYINYLETCPGVLFRNLSLAEIQLNSRTLQKFLRKWGGTVKHLDLNLIESAPNSKDFFKLLSKLVFKQCQNLDSLRFYIAGVNPAGGLKSDKAFLKYTGQTTGIKELEIYRMQGQSQEIGNCIQHLINSCPSLQKLYWRESSQNIYGTSTDTSQDPKVTSELIPVIAESKCAASLKKISVGLLSSKCLDILNKSRELHLTKANFVIDCGSRAEFWEFIEKQKSSMEYLDVTYQPENESFFGLGFRSYSSCSYRCNFRNISYVPLKWKLQDREIKETKYIRWEEHSKLSKLRILELRGFSHTDYHSQMAFKAFPDATTLIMTCEWSRLNRKVICQWTNLRVLEITFLAHRAEFPEQLLTMDDILFGRRENDDNNMPMLTSIPGLWELKVALPSWVRFKKEPVKNVQVYGEQLHRIDIKYGHRTISIDHWGYKESYPGYSGYMGYYGK